MQVKPKFKQWKWWTQNVVATLVAVCTFLAVRDPKNREAYLAAATLFTAIGGIWIHSEGQVDAARAAAAVPPPTPPEEEPAVPQAIAGRSGDLNPPAFRE